MLDTTNGTTKFTPIRTAVALLASPAATTAPWLTSESITPTKSATRTHVGNV